MAIVDEQVNAAAQQAQAGRLDLAIPALEAALRAEPGHAEGNRVMSLALLQTGRPEQALEHIQTAVRTAPHRADLHATLGSLLTRFGQNDRAIEALRYALSLDPRLAPVHALLATLLLERKDLDSAEDHYREALTLQPRFAEARTNLGSLMSMMGRQDEAVQLLRAGAAEHPNHPGLLINYCVALNYADGIQLEEIRGAHQHYGRVLMSLPGQVQTTWPNSRDPDRRLRIGFISPDFYQHSVAYFARPIVEGLDRRAFQVFLYSTGGRPDSMTQRLQQRADAWRECSRSNDQQLLDMIRTDQIDVLIELSGQTMGNRLIALRLRGAPVQVTNCGYPNTTGVPTIDYRIVDSITDPPNADNLCVEKLVRLDPCFLCYSPPDDAPPPTPPPSQNAGFITFGSFNSLKKLTPNVLKLWARLLHEVPRARLIIKTQGLESPRIRRTILDTLKREGIAEVRIDLWGRLPEKSDHLAAYAAIDIALDTFPYHGTTTTCEAMYMGVPVVSLTGDLHASRVGLSLLTAVGLPEFTAPDPDSYIRTAATLAADAPRLASLRSNLRPQMLQSPLCNQPAFTARFGDALRSMWRTHCTA